MSHGHLILVTLMVGALAHGVASRLLLRNEKFPVELGALSLSGAWVAATFALLGFEGPSGLEIIGSALSGACVFLLLGLSLMRAPAADSRIVRFPRKLTRSRAS